MFYEPIWIPNFPTISNRPNRPNNRPRHQPQIRFRPPRLTWNFTLNVIFWCASLPRIYSTHIWKLLTTFLKSAQQEKQEAVVKQKKGKSHGPWHSLLRFVPYVLTVICPYIRTVYRVTLRIAHLPATWRLHKTSNPVPAWVDQIQNLGGRSLTRTRTRTQPGCWKISCYTRNHKKLLKWLQLFSKSGICVKINLSYYDKKWDRVFRPAVCIRATWKFKGITLLRTQVR